MQYSTCRKSKKWYKYLFWVLFWFVCYQCIDLHARITKPPKKDKKQQGH
jgi:hypothetical protein